MLFFWISDKNPLSVKEGENKIYLQLFCNLCYNINHKCQEVLSGRGSMQCMPRSTLYLTLYNLFRKCCIFYSLMMLWANSRGQDSLHLCKHQTSHSRAQAWLPGSAGLCSRLWALRRMEIYVTFVFKMLLKEKCFIIVHSFHNPSKATELY